MQTHADKNQEIKSQSVSNAVSQKRSSGESDFQLVDNRSEAIQAQKLLEMTNKKNSFQIVDQRPETAQLKRPQELASNSPQNQRITQFQKMANGHTAKLIPPIQKKAGTEPGRRENNTGQPVNPKTGIENLSGYSMDDVTTQQMSFFSKNVAQLVVIAPVEETGSEHKKEEEVPEPIVESKNLDVEEAFKEIRNVILSEHIPSHILEILIRKQVQFFVNHDDQFTLAEVEASISEVIKIVNDIVAIYQFKKGDIREHEGDQYNLTSESNELEARWKMLLLSRLATLSIGGIKMSPHEIQDIIEIFASFQPGLDHYSSVTTATKLLAGRKDGISESDRDKLSETIDATVHKDASINDYFEKFEALFNLFKHDIHATEINEKVKNGLRFVNANKSQLNANNLLKLSKIEKFLASGHEEETDTKEHIEKQQLGKKYALNALSIDEEFFTLLSNAIRISHHTPKDEESSTDGPEQEKKKSAEPLQISSPLYDMLEDSTLRGRVQASYLLRFVPKRLLSHPLSDIFRNHPDLLHRLIETTHINLNQSGGILTTGVPLNREMLRVAHSMDHLKPQWDATAQDIQTLKAKTQAQEVKSGETLNQEIQKYKGGQFVLGRTVVFAHEDPKENFLAIKLLKKGEHIEEFDMELTMQKYLNEKSEQLKLRSVYPIPLGKYHLPTTLFQEFSGLIHSQLEHNHRIAKDRGEPPVKDIRLEEPKNDVDGAEEDNLIVMAYRAHPNYFVYQNAAHQESVKGFQLPYDTLSEEHFEIGRNNFFNDAMELLHHGISYPQLIDLNHAGGREYNWAIDIIRSYSGIQGLGKISNWKSAARFPNVRATGLADVGDVKLLGSTDETLMNSGNTTNDSETGRGNIWEFLNGQKYKYLVAQNFGNYMLSMVLIEGHKFFVSEREYKGLGLLTERLYNVLSEGLTSFLIGFGLPVNDKSLADAHKVVTKEEAEKIAKQMHFFMSYRFATETLPHTYDESGTTKKEDPLKAKMQQYHPGVEVKDTNNLPEQRSAGGGTRHFITPYGLVGAPNNLKEEDKADYFGEFEGFHGKGGEPSTNFKGAKDQDLTEFFAKYGIDPNNLVGNEDWVQSDQREVDLGFVNGPLPLSLLQEMIHKIVGFGMMAVSEGVVEDGEKEKTKESGYTSYEKQIETLNEIHQLQSKLSKCFHDANQLQHELHEIREQINKTQESLSNVKSKNVGFKNSIKRKLDALSKGAEPNKTDEQTISVNTTVVESFSSLEVYMEREKKHTVHWKDLQQKIKDLSNKIDVKYREHEYTMSKGPETPVNTIGFRGLPERKPQAAMAATANPTGGKSKAGGKKSKKPGTPEKWAHNLGGKAMYGSGDSNNCLIYAIAYALGHDISEVLAHNIRMALVRADHMGVDQRGFLPGYGRIVNHIAQLILSEKNPDEVIDLQVVLSTAAPDIEDVIEGTGSRTIHIFHDGAHFWWLRK